MTAAELAGPRLFPVPWARVGATPKSSAGRTSPTDASKLAVCTAAAPTDREGSGEGSPAFYEAAFREVLQLPTAGSAGNSLSPFEKSPRRSRAIRSGELVRDRRRPARDRARHQPGAGRRAPAGSRCARIPEDRAAKKPAGMETNLRTQSLWATPTCRANTPQGRARPVSWSPRSKKAKRPRTSSTRPNQMSRDADRRELRHESVRLGHARLRERQPRRAVGGFIGASGFLLAEVLGRKTRRMRKTPDAPLRTAHPPDPERRRTRRSKANRERCCAAAPSRPSRVSPGARGPATSRSTSRANTK